MTPFQSEIVTEARTWLGTPYVHQSTVKGAGTDCLGLLRGIWRVLNGNEPEKIPAYTMDWSEPQGEERLWAAAVRHLRTKEIDDEAPGDVLLFRMRSSGVAKHLGIVGRVGQQASFIHAYSNHGVIESSLTLPWRRRVAARFSFPEEIH